MASRFSGGYGPRKGTPPTTRFQGVAAKQQAQAPPPQRPQPAQATRQQQPQPQAPPKAAPQPPPQRQGRGPIPYSQAVYRGQQKAQAPLPATALPPSAQALTALKQQYGGQAMQRGAPAPQRQQAQPPQQQQQQQPQARSQAHQRGALDRYTDMAPAGRAAQPMPMPVAEMAPAGPPQGAYYAAPSQRELYGLADMLGMSPRELAALPPEELASLQALAQMMAGQGEPAPEWATPFEALSPREQAAQWDALSPREQAAKIAEIENQVLAVGAADEPDGGDPDPGPQTPPPPWGYLPEEATAFGEAPTGGYLPAETLSRMMQQAGLGDDPSTGSPRGQEQEPESWRQQSPEEVALGRAAAAAAKKEAEEAAKKEAEEAAAAEEADLAIGDQIAKDARAEAGLAKTKKKTTDLMTQFVDTEGPYWGGTQEEVQEAALEALYDLLTGKGDYGIPPEALEGMKKNILKAKAQGQADLSQHMGSRGLGVSGLAGAGFQGLHDAAAAQTAKLVFDAAMAGEESKIGQMQALGGITSAMSEQDMKKALYEFAKTESAFGQDMASEAAKQTTQQNQAVTMGADSMSPSASTKWLELAEQDEDGDGKPDLSTADIQAQFTVWTDEDGNSTVFYDGDSDGDGYSDSPPSKWKDAGHSAEEWLNESPLRKKKFWEWTEADEGGYKFWPPYKDGYKPPAVGDNATPDNVHEAWADYIASSLDYYDPESGQFTYWVPDDE